VTRPGVIARLSFLRGRAVELEDTAARLDVLAHVLPGAIERLGVAGVERTLRLEAGVIRARADQLRTDSAGRASASNDTR